MTVTCASKRHAPLGVAQLVVSNLTLERSDRHKPNRCGPGRDVFRKIKHMLPGRAAWCCCVEPDVAAGVVRASIAAFNKR